MRSLEDAGRFKVPTHDILLSPLAREVPGRMGNLSSLVRWNSARGGQSDWQTGRWGASVSSKGATGFLALLKAD